MVIMAAQRASKDGGENCLPHQIDRQGRCPGSKPARVGSNAGSLLLSRKPLDQPKNANSSISNCAWELDLFLLIKSLQVIWVTLNSRQHVDPLLNDVSLSRPKGTAGGVPPPSLGACIHSLATRVLQALF